MIMMAKYNTRFECVRLLMFFKNSLGLQKWSIISFSGQLVNGVSIHGLKIHTQQIQQTSVRSVCIKLSETRRFSILWSNYRDFLFSCKIHQICRWLLNKFTDCSIWQFECNLNLNDYILSFLNHFGSHVEFEYNILYFYGNLNESSFYSLEALKALFFLLAL